MQKLYTETEVVTTDGDGAATAYIGPRSNGRSLNGRIVNVIYTKHGVTPYSAGVDFAITCETTGQTVWTESNVDASKTMAPMQAAHSTAGVALVYAAADPVTVPVCLVNERLKIVVTNGGATKIGTFRIIMEMN